jgi:subtilase family serine protease
MGKKASEDDKSETQAGVQENTLNQTASGTSNNAGAINGNVSTAAESSDVTSSETSSADAAAAAKYPDLYIVKYDFSEDPVSGEEFTVNIKIGNKGNADAKSFHWEWDATHAGKDCDGKVNSLAVGKTVTVGCKFTYSSWAVYETKAVIDNKSEIYESNESNNENTKEVIPIHDQAKADLEISGYSFNHAPKSGEPFTVTIKIKNNGDAAASSFWWEWWPTHANKACRFMIGNLSAGGERVVTCPYTYASWSTYATKAVVDADNSVSESDESNNIHTEDVIPIH